MYSHTYKHTYKYKYTHTHTDTRIHICDLSKLDQNVMREKLQMSFGTFELLTLQKVDFLLPISQ